MVLMSVYVLTSMFSDGFPKEFERRMQLVIRNRGKFAFVASEFENLNGVPIGVDANRNTVMHKHLFHNFKITF